MDSMDIMDVMDIVDIMDIMDIMEIIDIMNIMNIKACKAMAGAVSALVLFDNACVFTGSYYLKYVFINGYHTLIVYLRVFFFNKF